LARQLLPYYESRALGSGEFFYDLRLRAQKPWSWSTAIGNVG
jgi:hypothetical protein